MLSTILLAGGALLLVLISFAAGRSVGWHARGYYEVAMKDLKEATIANVIQEEMAKIKGSAEAS